MVTERTTEGARPAIRAKRLRITESELTLESLLCVGNWFKDKSQNSNRNPTCNPETDMYGTRW
jgi:hypothetical protein